VKTFACSLSEPDYFEQRIAPSLSDRTLPRRREIEMVMEAFPTGTRFRNALELGAGDGGQSDTIARFCDRLTCAEINNRGFGARDLPNVTFQVLDARDLSGFGDSSFDFTFSSNMLEHVEGVNQCLGECRRVLAPNGPIKIECYNNILCPGNLNVINQKTPFVVSTMHTQS
jgi:ubiquinone/menaquinone biosynthesis C-methylase UbiE